MPISGKISHPPTLLCEHLVTRIKNTTKYRNDHAADSKEQK